MLKNSDAGVTNVSDAAAATTGEAGVAVGSPPNVNLAQNLAENDMVQEYLRMRQTQYESTMSEVASSSPSSQKDAKQDDAEEAHRVQQETAEAESRREQEQMEKARQALEAKRQQDAREEQERLAVKKEQERLAKETALKEQERLAEEAKKQQERLAEEEEAAKKEQERLAKEQARKEQERLDNERAKREQERVAIEAAKKEQERLAIEAAKKEQERLAIEAAEKEQERLDNEKAQKEQERVANEKAKKEQGRLAFESKIEQDRLAEEERSEKERLANKAEEMQDADGAAQKATAEKENVLKEEIQATPAKSSDKVQTISQPDPEEDTKEVDEIIVAASPIDLDMGDNNGGDLTVGNKGNDVDMVQGSELKAAEAPPPPEEVTYRKLNRQTSDKRSTKRGWGKTSRSNSGEMDESISSSQLKDIVPNIKPYLEDLNDNGGAAPTGGGGEEPDQMIMEIEEQQPTNQKVINHICASAPVGIHIFVHY